MRSRTGCQTCRQRKLKCDESKPTCGQCQKASRACVPSAGVIFRHQQNASMNGHEDEGKGQTGGKLGGFYAYRNTFDENNVWVKVPKNVTFLHITDPYNMESSPDLDMQDSSPPAMDSNAGSVAIMQSPQQTAPGLQALSAAATNNFKSARSASATAQSPDTQLSPHSNNLNFILNPAAPDSSIASPHIDPVLNSPAASENAYATSPDHVLIEDHEVSFLLRHFRETAGQWMDLYDFGRYFASHVPVQSVSNPLLRNSACAYAAKQLSRVRGVKPIIGGHTTSQAEMELYSHSATVDWAYIGAKYYDRAIQILMEEVSNSRPRELPATPQGGEVFSPQSVQSPQSMPPPRRRRRRFSRQSDADGTIAAAAILCVYEFMDHANTAWARHLSGTKALFDLAEEEEMMPVRTPSTPGADFERIKPSRARRATFWNFARQDFLASFINECQTRMNTEDLGLWRAAGLHLDQHGFVIPSNTDDEQFPERRIVMGEDMISNALVWLMSKIINFLASRGPIDNVFPQDRSTPTMLYESNQITLLERWCELEKELDTWYQGLPESFHGCARLPPIRNANLPSDHPRVLFAEIWHSLPACASAMQAYHMARIILLTNKPNESIARRSPVSSRLHPYRGIEEATRYHAHEICGIMLARPDQSVRVNAVQPLFVAGQYLTEDSERRILLDLLRGIESDLGWATDYRVQRLIREWGWSSTP